MRDELLDESLFFGLDYARSAITGVQHREAAFLARLADAGGLRRGHRRNRLRHCADQGLCACTGCSTRALWRNRNRLGSKRGWMKVQWQVMMRTDD
jgi:hypothetical protein